MNVVYLRVWTGFDRCLEERQEPTVVVVVPPEERWLVLERLLLLLTLMVEALGPTSNCIGIQEQCLLLQLGIGKCLQFRILSTNFVLQMLTGRNIGTIFQ